MAKRKSIVSLANFVQMAVGSSGSNVVNIMPNGSLQVGSTTNQTVLYSSQDPTTSVNGVSYKLLTEKNMADFVTAGGLNKITIMKVSGTFVKDAKTKRMVVELVGGGGAVPSCAALGIAAIAVASGGASGAYMKASFDSTQSAAVTSVAVTIGAGGVVAVTKGGDGGNTSFGSLVAKGGAGATMVTAGNLLGSYTMTGRARGGGYTTSAGATTMQTLRGMSGQEGAYIGADGKGGTGGSNPLGTGGQGMSTRDGVAMVTDMIPDGLGAGAGGFVVSGIGSLSVGCAGAQGAVIIWEYY